MIYLGEGGGDHRQSTGEGGGTHRRSTGEGGRAHTTGKVRQRRAQAADQAGQQRAQAAAVFLNLGGGREEDPAGVASGGREEEPSVVLLVEVNRGLLQLVSRISSAQSRPCRRFPAPSVEDLQRPVPRQIGRPPRRALTGPATVNGERRLEAAEMSGDRKGGAADE